MSVFGQSLKGRFAVLGIVIVLVLGSLLVRLWSMQVISGASYAKESENNRVREVSIPAPRGRILDRNGKPLVVNRPTLAVVAAPSVLKDKDLVTRLSAAINVPVPEITRRIQNTKQEALQPRTVAVDVPQHTVSYLSEHLSDFPGVEVQTQSVREYPNGSIAPHVLGYVGEISEDQLKEPDFKGYSPTEVVGKAGAEREFEKVLQGERGYQRLEVDAKGRVRRVLDRMEPRPGIDIKLTIDIDVQRAAEQALVTAMDEAHRQKFAKARAGAAVVSDVKTGEIIAMASAPTYDANLFLGGITQAQWRSLNDTASEFPLTNRALMSAYPPASTFKVVTGLASLEQGFATASTTFDCHGIWTFPGHEGSTASWWRKKCWKVDGHGTLDFVRGVEDSCDSVFYTLGYKFYTTPGEKLQAFARAAGFGAPTGVDLPGEVSGRVPDVAWKKKYNELYPEWQAWLPGDTVNMAIGQGDLLATPLQMSALFAGVANDGRVMKPHVLKEVVGSSGASSSRQTQPAVDHVIPVSQENLHVMQTALLGVTEQGTAQGAFSGFPIEVAGKTGTAQINSPNMAKTDPKYKDDCALFGGYAPAKDPKYAVVVVVEQGGHGGSVAAPAAREILSKLNGLPIVHVSTVDPSR